MTWTTTSVISRGDKLESCGLTATYVPTMARKIQIRVVHTSHGLPIAQNGGKQGMFCSKIIPASITSRPLVVVIFMIHESAQLGPWNRKCGEGKKQAGCAKPFMPLCHVSDPYTPPTQEYNNEMQKNCMDENPSNKSKPKKLVPTIARLKQSTSDGTQQCEWHGLEPNKTHSIRSPGHLVDTRLGRGHWLRLMPHRQ